MAAGTQYVDGRIPGQRIATTIETSDSSTFTTTATTVMSVTASLVSGRTYRIRAICQFESDTAGDLVVGRIQEDDSSGTQLSHAQTEIVNASSIGYTIVTEAEYTAASTGNKTFVLTGDRNGGSGTLFRGASSVRPSYLYVDYIRG